MRAKETVRSPTPISDRRACPFVRWDALQQDVIKEPNDTRLLVRAGPGTGKTAVACARVSHLIDKQDLSPDRIWMISFTRTAMREIRERIADQVEDPADAYSVKLATLDSHAWAIQSGFSDEDLTLGSYNENIQKMREIVRRDEAFASSSNVRPIFCQS